MRAPLPAAETQGSQKGAFTGATIALDRRPGDLTTIAAYTDLALQAEREGNLGSQVRAILEVAAMAGANAEVLAQLDAAGVAAADLGAAFAALSAAGWSDPIVIAPLGTMEPAYSGLPLVVDPQAASTYLVGRRGISAKILGPTSSEAVIPARVGRDIARAVMILGAEIGTGAVQTVG